MKLLKASIGMWFALLAIAVILGGLREVCLNPLVGQHPGHRIETVTLCLVYLGVIRCFVTRLKVSQTQALRIGVMWTAMLLMFEFTFFPFVMGVSWQELFVFF